MAESLKHPARLRKSLRVVNLSTEINSKSLAGWAVILERNDLYDVLSKTTKSGYPEVGLQLWHPTEDVVKHIYYWQAQYLSGEAESPIVLPDNLREYRDRMKLILASNRHNIRNFSPALLAGMDAIDLIASRHFRTPVAPYFWYRMLPKDELAGDENLLLRFGIAT